MTGPYNIHIQQSMYKSGTYTNHIYHMTRHSSNRATITE
uniref:Uncharacterized protein n=1 Tax=Anguilla anguilla TaxID=7936 RepID=A0A0E9PCG0_ANGAN